MHSKFSLVFLRGRFGSENNLRRFRDYSSRELEFICRAPPTQFQNLGKIPRIQPKHGQKRP